MARPLRHQWKVRTLVRRRHRTWMNAMTLATLGWGVWWVSILLHKLVPGLSPGLGATYVVTCTVAGAGLVLALFTVRARLIWVLLAGVPIFANGTLLMLPILLGDEIEELLTTRTTRTTPTTPTTATTRTTGESEAGSGDGAETDRPEGR